MQIQRMFEIVYILLQKRRVTAKETQSILKSARVRFTVILTHFPWREYRCTPIRDIRVVYF